ncbi:Two-component response regulator SSK1p [Malassezia cuniculi]|uniref:Two-component response regulator SSK1p n=1 Tax=Malassezia cuniculi TaxID=948313 RepID=A0AAF0ETJ9_9BASI|nr:Two-component response regulator SSK1p [Malassezia cuniculi]
MASLQAYQLLSQTMLQCIDLTLHSVSNTGSAHCAVAVSTPALFAVLHSSHAVRWLGSWILPSAANFPPAVTSEVSMSSDIGDMAQLAADMSSSDAAQNRVDLFLGAVMRRSAGGTPDTPGAQTLRFREGQGDIHTKWFPSAAYPVAMHTVLVHIFSRMVHIAVPDTTAKIMPYEEEGGSRLELIFKSMESGEQGVWPQWLGPQADLQGLLDGFGISISQNVRDATHEDTGRHTVVTVQLLRPQSVDLLSNLPIHQQNLPFSPIQELPLAHFQQQLLGRNVQVIAPSGASDMLASQITAFVTGWGCTTTDNTPDYVIIHENVDALRRTFETANNDTRIVFLAHLAHLDAAVSAMGASSRLCHVAFVPTPVCSLRLLWAMYMAGIPGNGGLFVDELNLRDSSQASASAARKAVVDKAPADPYASLRITSTWAQHGPQVPSSPRVAVPPEAAKPPEAPSTALSPHTVDYFNAAVSRLSERSKASSGLLIRDGDGRAAGIFFKPAVEESKSGGAEDNFVPLTANDHTRLTTSPEIQVTSRPVASGLAIQMDIRENDPPGAPLSTELSAEPAELLLGKADSASGAIFPSGHVIKPEGFTSFLKTPAKDRAPSDPELPPTESRAAEIAATSRVVLTRNTAPAALGASTPPASMPAATRAKSVSSEMPKWSDKMAHLPQRLRWASAQPQSGMIIGGQSTSTSKSSGIAENTTPSPAMISNLERRNKALREFVLPPIKVLIVEDNVINQRILATFLRQKKIQYQVANDGKEAVEKWCSGDFHLILMDIQLPVMDGIEATKEIRRREREMNAALNASSGVQSPLSPTRHSVIIVALTASVLVSDRVAALAAGCNDFLNKPVSLPWLQRKILEWGSMQYLLHAGISKKEPETQPSPRPSFKQATEAHASTIASNLRLNPPISPASRSGSASQLNGK